jgi:hypothetical protein
METRSSRSRSRRSICGKSRRYSFYFGSYVEAVVMGSIPVEVVANAIAQDALNVRAKATPGVSLFSNPNIHALHKDWNSK